MTTAENIETAEAKMNKAQDALLNYVERKEAIDGARYQQLVARLKRPEADFLKALSQLGS